MHLWHTPDHIRVQQNLFHLIVLAFITTLHAMQLLHHPGKVAAGRISPVSAAVWKLIATLEFFFKVSR